MDGLFSNCPRSKSFTINFFMRNALKAKSAQLACPFFTDANPLKLLVDAGCSNVRLIVRLCESTTPQALAEAKALKGVEIRFFTAREFHAKFYILGDTVLVGSANLTSAGLLKNRELSVAIGSDDVLFDEVPAYFDELWDAASVLTQNAFLSFSAWWKKHASSEPPPIDGIEPSSPATIAVKTQIKDRTRSYLEAFRSLYVEKLIPAHREVEEIYRAAGRRHPDFDGLPYEYELDRFLFWVRGFTTDEDLHKHPLRTGTDRRAWIAEHVGRWLDNRDEDLNIDSVRVARISRLQALFADEDALSAVGMDEMVDLLQGSAAFVEMQRFSKGGLPNHLKAFKADNDIAKVRASFRHLAFGEGDFVRRVYDTIYLPEFKLAHWGRNCAFELFGWTNHDGAPPFNGRIIKALRYLGFDVPT